MYVLRKEIFYEFVIANKWINEREKRIMRYLSIVLIVGRVLKSFDTLHFKNLSWSGSGVDNQRFACKIPTVHQIHALQHACSWIQEEYAWIASRAIAHATIRKYDYTMYMYACITFSLKLATVISNYAVNSTQHVATNRNYYKRK